MRKLNFLKSYIVTTNETNKTNVYKNANKLGLNYTFIQENEIDLIKDDTYIVFYDTFEVINDSIDFENLNFFVHNDKENNWEYIYFTIEPKLLFYKSKKINEHLYTVEPSDTAKPLGYIYNKLALKNDKVKVKLSFWPLFLEDSKKYKQENALIYTKNWYSYHIGYKLSEVLGIIILVCALGAILKFNFEKKFAKQVVFKSFE